MATGRLLMLATVRLNSIACSAMRQATAKWMQPIRLASTASSVEQAPNLDGDVDGNGAVNSTDRLYVTQQIGKKLLDPLLAWLDD